MIKIKVGIKRDVTKQNIEGIPLKETVSGIYWLRTLGKKKNKAKKESKEGGNKKNTRVARVGRNDVGSKKKAEKS